MGVEDDSSGDGAISLPGFDDVRFLGSGGFSSVYRARQVAFDRAVAVKVLAVSIDDDDARRRFDRECAATGRLTGHPHIVTIFDSGSLPDGRPFIVMELFPGGSLAARVRRDGPRTVEEVVPVGVKVAGALHVAHGHGIVHRDVKPENILVDRFGGVALADFGVSIVADRLQPGTATTAYTLSHVAPEILEGQPASVSSDIYSLGSTLFHLLAGRPAFSESAAGSLAVFIDRVLRAPLPRLGDHVPVDVQDVLARSMAKAPTDRYATAEELGHALRGCETALGVPPTPLLAVGVDDWISETEGDEVTVGRAPGASRPMDPGSSPGDGPGRPVVDSEATVLPPAPPVVSERDELTGHPTVSGGRVVELAPPPTGTHLEEVHASRWRAVLVLLTTLVVVGSAWLWVGRDGGEVQAATTTTRPDDRSSTTTASTPSTAETTQTTETTETIPTTTVERDTAPTEATIDDTTTWTGRPILVPLERPRRLHASPGAGSGEINLGWDDPDDDRVTEYVVYRTEHDPSFRLHPDAEFEPVDRVPRGESCSPDRDRCFYDVPPGPGAYYCYRVTSAGDGLESEPSDVACSYKS